MKLPLPASSKSAADLDIDSTGGSGYTAGTYEGVKLTGGSGSGAIATVVVSAGTSVDSVVITSGGSGYADTDTGLGLSHADLTTAGTAATVSLQTGDTMDVRGNSDNVVVIPSVSVISKLFAAFVRSRST